MIRKTPIAYPNTPSFCPLPPSTGAPCRSKTLRLQGHKSSRIARANRLSNVVETGDCAWMGRHVEACRFDTGRLVQCCLGGRTPQFRVDRHANLQRRRGFGKAPAIGVPLRLSWKARVPTGNPASPKPDRIHAHASTCYPQRPNLSAQRTYTRANGRDLWRADTTHKVSIR